MTSWVEEALFDALFIMPPILPLPGEVTQPPPARGGGAGFAACPHDCIALFTGPDKSLHRRVRLVSGRVTTPGAGTACRACQRRSPGTMET